MIVTKARTVGRTARGVVCRPASSGNPAAKAARTALSLAMTLMLVLPLAGCKYTDVLTEKIIDQNAEIDWSLEPVRLDAPDGVQDTLKSMVEAPSEREDTQQQTEATYGDNPTTDQQTSQQQYADDVAHDQNATAGDQTSSSSGQKGSTVEVQSANPDSDGDTPEGDPDEPEKPGSNPPITNTPPGKVYDSGTINKLPTGTKKIAASGQYALIVQMLGGKGALAAADEGWLSTVQASAAFSNEGLDKVTTAWSGNGVAAGSADVDAIINSGADVVLTSSSYGGIQEDEAEALNAAGVNVVVMPVVGVASAADADIVQAVRVVGELLKDAGTAIQYDAQAMAATYVSQHDTTLGNCLNSNRGYTTWLVNGVNWPYIYQGSTMSTPTTNISSNRKVMAFVDTWAAANVLQTEDSERIVGSKFVWPATDNDDDSIVVDISDGMGVSLPCLSTSYNLLSYYAQHAGVMNITDPTVSTWIEMGEGFFSSFSSPSYRAYPIGTRQLWFCFTQSNYSSPMTTIGDDVYPAIVVRDESIAQRVLNSASKVNGYYNYGQPYEVWVMPSGLSGSWVDGTVESFLVAPWAYCMYQQGENLSACDGYVNDFYSTFYRCGPAEIVQDYSTVYQATCPRS